MVKWPVEWIELKIKISGGGRPFTDPNWIQMNFDHHFSPKQKNLQFSRFFKNFKIPNFLNIRKAIIFNGSPFEAKLGIWSPFFSGSKSTGHPVYLFLRSTGLEMGIHETMKSRIKRSGKGEFYLFYRL